MPSVTTGSDVPLPSSIRDQCSEVLQFVCHEWGNRRLLGERRRPAGAGLASTDPFLLLVAMQQHQQRAQVRVRRPAGILSLGDGPGFEGNVGSFLMSRPRLEMIKHLKSSGSLCFVNIDRKWVDVIPGFVDPL